MAGETLSDPGDEHRRALVYRLVLLQQARSSVERELRAFTETATRAVQIFLDRPETGAAPDCLSISIGLEERVLVLQQLSVFFQDLRSVSGPESCSALIPKRQPPFPALRGASDERGILKFGPMLRNVLMATSITNAVQTLGAMLALGQIRGLLTPHTKMVSCSTSTYFNLKKEVFTTPGFEKEKVRTERAGGRVAPQMVVPLMSGESSQSGIGGPCAIMTKTVKPKMRRGPACLLDIHLGNGLEVNHQKQTSSQLISFLRTYYESDHVTGVDLFKGNPEAQSALPMEVTVAPLDSVDHQRTLENELSAADGLKPQRLPCLGCCVPVFKIRRTSKDGVSIYRCTIATKSELWDICDICIEEAALSNCLLEQDLPLPAETRSGGHEEPEVAPGCGGPRGPRLLTAVEVKEAEVVDSTLGKEGTGEKSDGDVTIPEFKIRKFEEMEVTVTHVDSPASFFIQSAGAELQELTRKLNQDRSSSCARIKCVPDIGAHVVGWFPRQQLWCRGVVLKICGMQGEVATGRSHERLHRVEVEVMRIDFGDAARLVLVDLWELSAELAAVPRQALCVSLANVSPLSGGQWTSEAISWFREKVGGRKLYARLYPTDGAVKAELFMDKGRLGAMRRGASVSLQLTENGHATHDRLRRAAHDGGLLLRAVQSVSPLEDSLLYTRVQGLRFTA